MTPANEIQAAARTLRSLLADRQLTPGPWLSMDRGDRILWDGDGAEDQPPVYVVDEPISNGANADYIAVMHPDVGLALATLLEAVAANPDDPGVREGAARHVGCDPSTCPTAAALAVARQILGSQP